MEQYSTDMLQVAVDIYCDWIYDNIKKYLPPLEKVQNIFGYNVNQVFAVYNLTTTALQPQSRRNVIKLSSCFSIEQQNKPYRLTIYYGGIRQMTPQNKTNQS